MDLLTETTLTIRVIDLLALKKLALVSRALEERLTYLDAKREQKALTDTLVEVVTRAELALARGKA